MAAAIPSNLSSSEVEEHVGNRLQNYVKGCTSFFVCGGRVKLDAPVSVTLLDEVGRKKDPIVVQVPRELREEKLRPSDYAKRPPNVRRYPDPYPESEKKRAELFDQQAADLDGLVGVIPRAAFGKGGETVYDATIRDALQLKSDKFELSLPKTVMDGILREIKAKLDLRTDVVAEPYSLNVYQKGGKFAKHKDTPRGEDMMGTLVLCLPSWFTGGKMTVELGEESETCFENLEPRGYSWNPASPRDPCKIEWCAFFADVDHEIHTVEEGLRITVAYLLRRKDLASASSIIPRALEGQEQADRINEIFLEGLRDERFFPAGGKVGFPCQHLYTNEEMFPSEKESSSQALTAAQLDRLKGRDLMIANAARSANLSVRMQPYLLNEYSRGNAGDWPLPKFPTEMQTYLMCQMSDRSIKRDFMAEEPRQPDADADLWILDYDEGAENNIGEGKYSADGYFGNEASDLYFYVKSCMIIEVPSYSDSRGGVESDLPRQKKQKTELSCNCNSTIKK